mgnify:FL=1
MLDSLGGTTLVVTAGRIYYLPIFVADPQTYIRIGAEVTVAGAAGKVIRLGIHAWNKGVPGALVLDAGTIAADAVATAEITISKLLQGWYFLTFVSDGAPTVRALLNTYAIPPVSGLRAGQDSVGPVWAILIETTGNDAQATGGLADPATAPDTGMGSGGPYIALREN